MSDQEQMSGIENVSVVSSGLSAQGKRKKKKQDPPAPKKPTAMKPPTSAEVQIQKKSEELFEEMVFEYLKAKRQKEELEEMLRIQNKNIKEMEEQFPSLLGFFKEGGKKVGKVATKRSEEIKFEKYIKSKVKLGRTIKKEEKKKVEVIRKKRKQGEKEYKLLENEYSEKRNKRIRVEEKEEEND